MGYSFAMEKKKGETLERKRESGRDFYHSEREMAN